MSITVVRNQLLSTLGGATALRVIAEGENFTPKTADFPFVRFSIVPRETTNETLGTGSINREHGLANATVWHTRLGNSIDAGLSVAETIKDAFRQQIFNLTNNQLVINSSWIETAIHDTTCVGVPVLIRWTNLTK